MKKFIIDGRFLASQSTGIDRYAMESLNELDKLCEGLNISILVPPNSKSIPQYKNIKIIQSKLSKCWTQLIFGGYARVTNSIAINLCNEVSLLAPKGIVCLHDVCYAEELNLFSKNEIKWFLKIYKRIVRRTLKILTVSEFSKKRIIKLFNVSPDKIVVAGNGWQHFNEIKLDEGIFDRFPKIIKNHYFFTLSSANSNKNIKWVMNASKMNCDQIFVVAGKNLDKVVDQEKYDNVINVGYITDEEAKCLMKYCKAFLFPSLYEGFGIPPMEAMSIGASVIVSNTTCLPEIYGNSAHYIDPYQYNVDLNKLMSEQVDPLNVVLDKYSWEATGKILFEVLSKIANN